VTCHVIDPATPSACTNACHMSFTTHPSSVGVNFTEYTPVGYRYQRVAELSNTPWGYLGRAGAEA
jgi:hypothetical protein